MSFVVFLRGVNVGGHKTFKPSELVKGLARELDVKNVGAAGTLVVRSATRADVVRDALARALPFECGIMLCPSSEIAKLLREPFARTKLAEGQTRFVSVLESAPAKAPRLPIVRPEDDWQVRLVRFSGRYALSVRRRTGSKRMVYPNEVVEKLLGLSATTRTWDTIVKAMDLIEG